MPVRPIELESLEEGYGPSLRLGLLFRSQRCIRFPVQRVGLSRNGLSPTSAPDTPQPLDCRLLTYLLCPYLENYSQISWQVNVLMLGCANIWWVPLSNVFGRRPIILASLVMLTLCSVWAAKATSFNSLLAARVFQGIAGAAADTLCPGLIGEIYFRHQRGRAMVSTLQEPAVLLLWRSH